MKGIIFIRSLLFLTCISLILALCACQTSDASHTHSYITIEAVNPTCLSSGRRTYQCADCEYFFKETIPARGHSPDSTGKCTECGHQLVKLSGKLPITISYTWGTNPDNIYTKVNITAVSFSSRPYGSTLIVTLNGKKTYDYKGDVGTTTAKVLVVIKDSKGSVVGSEELYDMHLVVGQAFQKSAEFNVSPDETYTIELRDCSV